MLDWLPALGARKKAREAVLALRRGAVDEASVACRAYFARRLPQKTTALGGVDAQMATLTALCAALREDEEELKAVEAMVGGTSDESAVAARAAVRWLTAALKGDLDAVLGAIPPPGSMLAPHVLGIVLLAIERSSAIGREHDSRIHDQIAALGGTPALQATASCVLAVAALRSGNRAEAVRHLEAIPGSASPFSQVLAAMARDDVSAAAKLLGTLPSEERGPATSVAAALAVGSSIASCKLALEALGPHASSGARSTLAAALAVALAREGQAREARGVVQTETRGTPSPPLAAAEAFIGLLSEDAAAAQNALRGAPAGDPVVTALRLLALVQGGRHDDLLQELGTKPELLPEHRVAVANAVLFALARAGAAPEAGASPPWLLEQPEDPEALYAWALLRSRQGAAEEAVSAFTKAIQARPDLASLGDAPDAACLVLARQHIVDGKPEEAVKLTSRVSAERLKATATRLEALAYVQSVARERKVALTADKVPGFIDKLAMGLLSSSREAKLLAVLRGEIARARVSQLLRSGDGKRAVAHLDALRSSWDGDAAFLDVATRLSHGGMTPADAEESLTKALASEPSHQGLRVLLAEVQTALRGADAGLATLESMATAQQGALFGQALASAYRGARRGLEAKRFGFNELRRAGEAPPDLLAELRDVLRFEVPARTPDVGGERIARAPLGALIPEAGLSARAHLLLSRAGAAAQRDAGLRGAFEAAIQRLKRSLMADDTAGARAAELELIELMGRAAA